MFVIISWLDLVSWPLILTTYHSLTAPFLIVTIVSSQLPKQEEKEEERRPLKYTLPGDPYGLVDITDVPKGKLSIVEALRALASHKREPQTWTAEKIAQEYSLNIKDTNALLQFFIPFEVKIIPPKTENVKHLKGS